MVPAIAEPSRPAREMPDSSLEVRSERSGLRRLAVSGVDVSATDDGNTGLWLSSGVRDPLAVIKQVRRSGRPRASR
jgi:hypothetical protein